MKIRGTNFLDFFHKKRNEKRRFYLFIKILVYVFIFVAISSIVIAAVYFGTARRVYDLAEAGKHNLELASSQAESLDFEKTNNSLALAENNFREAGEIFGRLKFLEKVPWVGNQYEAVANLLETGVETSSALRDVIGVVSDIMEVTREAEEVVGGIPTVGGETSFAEIPSEKKREILQKFFESPPRLQGAKAKIDLALLALDKIKEDRVANQILKFVNPVRETLLKLQSAISKLIPAAEILPQIAGYPDEKTYLFLLQNSDELRPTGGFIGTYGIVKVKDGEVNVFKTDNIYALDGPSERFLRLDPPDPLQKYLRVGAWFMRDANWSPDFPTAALRAEFLYHAERGPEQKIDAVVAVTPNFIEDILRQIGNIEIDGEIFTPDNLMDVLQYKVEKEYYEKGIPEAERKDIVGKLGEKILERLANLPASRWSSIFGVTEKALNEKHLLFWSKDQELQTVIAREDWGGEVKNFAGDYLMVVDANLASLKTDSVMERKINYSFAAESDGKLHARADITYKNKGSFTWKTTRYRTYTRIYVPAGSVLVRGIGMMENDKISDPYRRPGKVDRGEELNKTFFGAFISIEPGEERTLSFEYILPEEIKNQTTSGLYKLFVQKQSGTIGHPLTLNLNFGKKIIRAVPAEEQREWGNDVYKLQTDLRIDREFQIGL
jgi:hypothetical protein